MQFTPAVEDVPTIPPTTAPIANTVTTTMDDMLKIVMDQGVAIAMLAAIMFALWKFGNRFLTQYEKTSEASIVMMGRVADAVSGLNQRHDQTQGTLAAMIQANVAWNESHRLYTSPPLQPVQNQPFQPQMPNPQQQQQPAAMQNPQQRLQQQPHAQPAGPPYSVPVQHFQPPADRPPEAT